MCEYVWISACIIYLNVSALGMCLNECRCGYVHVDVDQFVCECVQICVCFDNVHVNVDLCMCNQVDLFYCVWIHECECKFGFACPTVCDCVNVDLYTSVWMCTHMRGCVCGYVTV